MERGFVFLTILLIQMHLLLAYPSENQGRAMSGPRMCPCRCREEEALSPYSTDDNDNDLAESERSDSMELAQDPVWPRPGPIRDITLETGIPFIDQVGTALIGELGGSLRGAAAARVNHLMMVGVPSTLRAVAHLVGGGGGLDLPPGFPIATASPLARTARGYREYSDYEE